MATELDEIDRGSILSLTAVVAIVAKTTAILSFPYLPDGFSSVSERQVNQPRPRKSQKIVLQGVVNNC